MVTIAHIIDNVVKARFKILGDKILTHLNSKAIVVAILRVFLVKVSVITALGSYVHISVNQEFWLVYEIVHSL